MAEKAKLRRVHVRIDVVTESSNQRSVVLVHRAGDGLLRGLLLRLVMAMLSHEGLQLVGDADELPLDDDGEARTEPPQVDVEEPAPRLTVARAPALPSKLGDFAPPRPKLPPVSPASPSVKATPAGGDSAAPVKRPKRDLAQPPGSTIRIEAGPAGPPADFVIGPTHGAQNVAPSPALSKAKPTPATATASDAAPVRPRVVRLTGKERAELQPLLGVDPLAELPPLVPETPKNPANGEGGVSELGATAGAPAAPKDGAP